jgi:dTDP-4-amino-4,6-dideoxygalactose transaminase
LLYQALKNSSTGQPFIKIEQDTVPYVFPFLLNNSEDFHYIRSQGIQILRWEEFYPTNNHYIERYRTRLIQIPCHQGLTKQEINKIILIINKENTSYVK